MSLPRLCSRLAHLEAHVWPERAHRLKQHIEQLSDAALDAWIANLEATYGPLAPVRKRFLDALPDAELWAIASGDPRAIKRYEQ
jgi:hypothetical protein